LLLGLFRLPRLYGAAAANTVGLRQQVRCKSDITRPGQSASAALPPVGLRAKGLVRASFARVGERTEPGRVFEAGGLRLRFPRGPSGCEAVLVNTAGGVAGGDHAAVSLTLEAGAEVFATTQSAEKIYRAEDAESRVECALTLGAGSRLVWAPQETILFDKACLKRRLGADVAADASLLLIESVVFGRLAMGETDIQARFSDHWRIRRGGRLVFAEALRIDNPGATLKQRAVAGDARAIASFLFMAPNATAPLEAIRAVLEEVAAAPGEVLEAGVSALDGLIIGRALSPSPARLRAAIVAVMMALTGRAPPRVWR
jgi:urease accessory protein